MTDPSTSTSNSAAHDHGFHTLRVLDVVRETEDASSFVLEIPAELGDAYSYQAGQFCTFRFEIDGEAQLRCYSMSSAPAVDDELKVTVKRVPGGVVSNWMNDRIQPGDPIDVTRPAGVFQLVPGDRPLVAFGGGSGITPVLSLIKQALATTSRRVWLLYANRDRDSIIFAAELDELLEKHPDRLTVLHRLDVEEGFLDRGAVDAFVESIGDADHYICGPTPFMDIVEEALLARGIAEEQIHLERFSVSEVLEDEGAPEPGETAAQVTIKLGNKVETAEHRPGTTILQMARQMNLSAPFSCESGSCATCMALVTEGSATMRVNNALTPDEVAEGWVLTCQAVPTSESVRVVYEGA